MEETLVGTLVTLACTVVPCLLMILAVGGAAYYFLRKKNPPAVRAASTAPAAPVMPVMPPAPAAPAATAAPAAPRPAAAAPVMPVPNPAAASPVTPAFPATSAPSNSHLTPSEIVVLRGDAFALAAGMLNAWEVVGKGMKVSGPPLTDAVLTAAFFALEQSGSVRLEPGKKKAMLGLGEKDTVYIVPTGQPSAYPELTFESQILQAAQSLAAKNKHTVQDVVFTVLRQDDSLPWMWVLQMAHDMLNARGMFEMIEEKKLLMKSYRYTLKDSTAALLAQTSPTPVQAMISEAQTARPALYQVLIKEIHRGLDARRESPDD